MLKQVSRYLHPKGGALKLSGEEKSSPLRLKTKSKEMRALSFFVAKNNEKVLEIR